MLETETTKEAVRTRYAELAIIAAEGPEEDCCGGSSCACGVGGNACFGPGEYTPTQDAREIWWNRNKVSTQNNKAGAYVETEPGKRYKSGQWPQGDPPVFAQQ